MSTWQQDPNPVWSYLATTISCQVSDLINVRQIGNAQTFDISCEGVNQKNAAAEFALGDNRFTGTSTMKIGGT